MTYLGYAGYASLLQVLDLYCGSQNSYTFQSCFNYWRENILSISYAKSTQTNPSNMCCVSILLHHSLGYLYHRHKDLGWHWYSTHSRLVFSSFCSPGWPWTWNSVWGNRPVPPRLTENCFLIIDAVISLPSFFFSFGILIQIDAFILREDL